MEYTLTQLGATLRGAVGEMVAWVEAPLPEIEVACEPYDQQPLGWAAAE